MAIWINTVQIYVKHTTQIHSIVMLTKLSLFWLNIIIDLSNNTHIAVISYWGRAGEINIHRCTVIKMTTNYLQSGAGIHYLAKPKGFTSKQRLPFGFAEQYMC